MKQRIKNYISVQFGIGIEGKGVGNGQFQLQACSLSTHHCLKFNKESKTDNKVKFTFCDDLYSVIMQFYKIHPITYIDCGN